MAAEMVQIIENWSDVRGRVETVEHATDGPADGLVLQLRVEAADPVAGFPNLLADALGKVIPIRGPTVSPTPQPGQTIRCRVRKAGLNRYFFLPNTLTIQQG